MDKSVIINNEESLSLSFFSTFPEMRHTPCGILTWFHILKPFALQQKNEQ